MRVSDSGYGDNGAIAWVNCPSGATETGSNPNRTCYGQRLNWNTYSGYASTWNTTYGARYVACRELGHTIGLRHTAQTGSCLRSQTPNSATTNTYSGQDVTQVLNHY
ncbi:hypothetical protein GCM10023146_06020 [Nocardioides caricicola]